MTFVHAVASVALALASAATSAQFVKGNEAVVTAAELAPDKLAAVNWAGYMHNLVPVTIGNMVGGILFVAVFYYLVFKHNLEKMD